MNTSLVKSLIVILLWIPLGVYVGSAFTQVSNGKKVTIIFNKAPVLSDTIAVTQNGRFRITGSPPILLWNNYWSTPLKPKAGQLDTLSMAIHDGSSVMLQHRYQRFFNTRVILHPNDTLLVNYNEERPVFHLLNRENKFHDLNVDSLSVATLSAVGRPYPALLFYNAYPLLKSVNEKLTPNPRTIVPKEQRQWGDTVIAEMERERRLADSLWTEGELSRDTYLMMKDRARFTGLEMRYKLGELTDAEAREIVDSMSTRPSTLPYSHYIDFCKLFVRKNYSSHPEFLYSNREMIPPESDYFTRVKEADLIPHQIRQILLYEYINRAANQLTADEFLNVFQQFDQFATKKELVTNLRKSFVLDFDSLRRNAAVAILTDTAVQHITLQQFLDGNKGDLVYIDLWASWCEPCRRAMPASRELKHDYADQRVRFVYLSLDRKFDDWAKAAKEEGLWESADSFLFLNAGKAEWAKQIELGTIPRYLLFDTTGQLVHKNAPGPDGDEIRELLDQYLEE